VRCDVVSLDTGTENVVSAAEDFIPLDRYVPCSYFLIFLHIIIHVCERGCMHFISKGTFGGALDWLLSY